MNVEYINIAEDFSDMPYGRYDTDGPDNGSKFRIKYLLPAMLSADKVEVFMDGTMGYGSSFLDEAFAGLYRSNNIPKKTIKEKLIIHCSLQYIVDSIFEYIDSAKRE
ncbi:STAS-like domain-containing protein [Providencia sp.]